MIGTESSTKANKEPMHLSISSSLGLFNYSSMTSNIILVPSLKLFWNSKQSVLVWNSLTQSVYRENNSFCSSVMLARSFSLFLHVYYKRIANVVIVAAFPLVSSPARPAFQEWHRNGFGSPQLLYFRSISKYVVLCRILIYFFHLGIISL